MNRATGDLEQLRYLEHQEQKLNQILILYFDRQLFTYLEQLECLYTEELVYPRHAGKLAHLGQMSPTTDKDIFSSWF